MTAVQFANGDRVRVRDLAAETGLSGHMRAPVYCRGHSGEVERVCGVFGNPETLAYGGDGRPTQPLYRVRFRQKEVWPDYCGPAGDTIEIELYQHWLTAETS
ncbi:MAG: nitrile hydratase [Kiloniella sp.]|nr:nitrile hydratase [Kiloniella sp.]RZO31258.1 MAG: nitrile hydratase subunit beta [Rhodospirillaceae bacterium]